MPRLREVRAVGGRAATNSSCAVRLAAAQTLTLDGSACSPWVFANAGAQGYYRTAYSPDTLRALTPRVQDVLTAPERLSLAGDEWALVRAGRHGVGDYLTLATGFGNERTDGVLGNVTDRLDFIHDYLTTDATRAAVRTIRADAVRPALRSRSDSNRRPSTATRSAPCAPRSSKRSGRPAATPTSRPARARLSTARSPADRRSTRRSPARSSPWPPNTATARFRTLCSRPPTRRRLPTSTTGICTRWRGSAIRRSSIARSNTR